jgi:hypothetical protein
MKGLEAPIQIEDENWHSSREEIRNKIRRHFVQRAEYVKTQNVYLAFALLEREWICDAAKPAFVDIPMQVAMTIKN